MSTSSGRRLPPQGRYDQLAATAQESVARDGWSAFSLEEVAERCGVSRNLIYRYFPRGRLDLFLAAIHLSGEQLTGGWVTDPARPIEQRMAENFGRMRDHAAGPSSAWMVHRQARSCAEPEVQAVLESYLARVIAGVSLNHFGTETPPPLAHLALGGYLAFAEHALDEARQLPVSVDTVFDLLGRVLADTVAAVHALLPAPPGLRPAGPRPD